MEENIRGGNERHTWLYTFLPVLFLLFWEDVEKQWRARILLGVWIWIPWAQYLRLYKQTQDAEIRWCHVRKQHIIRCTSHRTLTKYRDGVCVTKGGRHIRFRTYLGHHMTHGECWQTCMEPREHADHKKSGKKKTYFQCPKIDIVETMTRTGMSYVERWTERSSVLSLGPGMRR